MKLRNLATMFCISILTIPLYGNAMDKSAKLPFSDTEHYRISRGYGEKSHKNKDFYALDFADPENDGEPRNVFNEDVLSSDKGEITLIYKSATYGLNVEIKHADGTFSRYAHLGEK